MRDMLGLSRTTKGGSSVMLGSKIQKLRKRNGMSQEDLASKLTISRQAISKWELGESVPDTENVLQLSKLFGVSTDYLLNDEYEREEEAPVRVSSIASNIEQPEHITEKNQITLTILKNPILWRIVAIILLPALVTTLIVYSYKGDGGSIYQPPGLEITDPPWEEGIHPIEEGIRPITPRRSITFAYDGHVLEEFSMRVGEKITLSIIMEPEDFDSLHLSVSDPEVIKRVPSNTSGSGARFTITAIGPGTATLTVTDGDITAVCTIYVGK